MSGKDFETVCFGAEIRAEADTRKLRGIVMPYGTVSLSHRERFLAGSLSVASRGVVNLLHDRSQAISGWPGSVEFRDTGEGLETEISVDDSPEGKEAIARVLAGELAGFSVEFNRAHSKIINGIREVSGAVLVGIGLVRAPSYSGTAVSLRERERGRGIWIC